MNDETRLGETRLGETRLGGGDDIAVYIERKKTITDCVVDAVRSSIPFMQNLRRRTGRTKDSYTKAFSAEEPYCIIRVWGFVAKRDENDKFVESRYVIYSVNGGNKCKMTIQKFKTLCAELFPEDLQDDQDDLMDHSYERFRRTNRRYGGDGDSDDGDDSFESEDKLDNVKII